MTTLLSISNLSPSVNSSALEDMFTLIGNVCSAKVLCDSASGASLGRGVVEMSTHEEAQNCTLHFDGQVLDGQALMVRLHQTKPLPPPFPLKVAKKGKKR